MNVTTILAAKVADLRKLATKHNVQGRSKMNGEQLRAALLTLVAPAVRRMSNDVRQAVYGAQNGTTRLTARQARRIKKNAFATV